MEIKRIKEESYESIIQYLNVMMSLVSRFDDLCFVDYNGKRYMVGIGDEKIAYIENDNGDLNPYYIQEVDPILEKYGTEEYDYDIITQSDLKEVVRKSRLDGNAERLSYMPRIDNFPRDVIDYVQYVDNVESTFLQKYDVTTRCNLNDSFTFCDFHEPDVIQVTVLKKFLFSCIPKTYDYSLGVVDDFYYQPLIKIKDLLIGTKGRKYPSREFIDEICERGFNAKIPKELSSLVMGTNETHKTLKLIGDEYKNYIKRG